MIMYYKRMISNKIFDHDLLTYARPVGRPTGRQPVGPRA